MKGIKVAAGYLIFITAIFLGGCRTTKSVEEKVVEKDKIEYALPGQTQISLRALCDTLERIQFKNQSGPVQTKIVYRDSEPVLEIKYDTIWKEKEVIRWREKEVEVVKRRVDWTYVFITGGIIVLFIVFPGIPGGINRFFKRLIGII